MNQDTITMPLNQRAKPAPFNLGDHVCYIADQKLAVPGGAGSEAALVLVPGMVGVIVLSNGSLSEEGAAAPNPWHCQVQFDNGFQLDIKPENSADFERTNGHKRP